MSDLNTEIKLTASADGVETGVARAKRSLADLGATAAKAGSEGGKGLEGIGAGGEAAARKVDAATRSMQNSLQRQIAALEAGGTATRQYQESLAKLRGVDASAIKPLLDQLDAARAKADGAGQGFLGMGSASSLLQGQLAALAGSLTLGSMAAFVLQINNGIDALNDIKDATGSTIENISALEDVGKRTGASLDLVGSILIKFNDVLSKAGPKSDIALQLQAIGLSAEELKRLDPAEALLRTAQALQKYADDGNKARLVQDLFGKSVKDAAPFLNDLAAKGELVAKVTSQQAEEAEKFNKELFALQANIQEASRRLAGPMVTAINEVAEAFRKGSAEGKGFWENASDRYWSNVRGFYGGNTPAAGGSVGSVGSGDTALARATAGAAGDNRPSVVLGPTAAEIAAAETAARAAAQRAAAARERELAEQAKFYADLSGLSADYYDKLARAQQERAAGNISEAQYVEYVEQLIQKQPFATALTRDNAAALKAQTAAVLEAAKASATYYSAIGQDLTRLDDQNERLRQEGQQIGLTAEGLLALTLARQDHAIAMEQERLTLLQANEGSTAEILLQQRRIELLKEQRALTASNGQRQIAADAAKDATQQWERASQQIEQSLTDALMRGFESGKGFAEVLRDTVVNMFKTLVLRPVIQATVQGGLNAVGLGLPGGQGSGLGGSVLGNAASNYATSTIGTAVFGSNAAYGAALGTTSIGGGSQAAMLAAQTGEFGAAGLAATAQAGGGAMASFAAAAPWVLGALAVASILSSMDDSGTLHTGGMASYSATGGLQTSTEHGAFGMGFGGVERGEQTVGMVSGLTRSTVGMLDSTSKLFGGKGGYSVATGFADDSSRDSAWGGLLIKDGQGNTQVNWNDDRTSRWAPREFADGQAGAQQYALAVAKDVRDVLIEETPAWADTMLTALGDAPTLEQLAGTVAQIHAAAAAFDTMGRASEQFAALSESAMDALVTAMGGAEAAVAGLGNYYSSFYTDAERADVTRSQLQDKFTGLGLGELPQTREQFRSIVESLDLTTVSGREMYAELIKLSPAFASITEATQDAGAAMAAAAEQAARAAEQAFEKAKTTAYSQLEASAERERALWEQQATAAASLRDEVRGVFDTLATNIRELRGEALGPELTAAQGQAFINGALASVNAGTGLPDGEGLTNAIAAVRGGLSSPGMYANSMERDFAALRLAGELSVLQEAAGEQLTTAELQLQAAENQIDQLDETLAYWRKLIDGTEDGIDATKSVEEAVKALTLLMFPEDTAAGGAAGAGAGGSGFVIGGTAPGSGPARPAPAPSTLSRLGNTYYGAGGTAITDVGYVDRFDSVNSYVNTLDWSEANKGASAAALTAAATQYGVSAREISIATGMPQADVEALLPGIPRYLLGTNYVPQDGLAYLHKGEEVIPAQQGLPYRPPVVTDNTQVVALLQQIATRVAALEGHAATSADANTQTADVLTRVAPGDAITIAAAPTIATVPA